jgi:hypothetical protein
MSKYQEMQKLIKWSGAILTKVGGWNLKNKVKDLQAL